MDNSVKRHNLTARLADHAKSVRAQITSETITLFFNHLEPAMANIEKR